MTDGVVDGFGTLIGFVPDDDFFFHPRLFADDRLLTMGGYVNCPLLERFAGQPGSWAIDWPALDRDPLLAQSNPFLNRVLDGVHADPHATLLHYALADFQLLFIDRNNFFLRPGSAGR